MTESDLYPGLDAELEAVYERNVAEGRAKPAEEVAVSGLETVVEEQLQRGAETIRIPEIVRDWANPELVAALQSWDKYKGILHMESTPSSVEELSASNPNFAETLTRLHAAKEALTGSGEQTPEGLNVGETMHLVLVPWEELRRHLDSTGNGLKTLLKQLRDKQGVATAEDYINDSLFAAIKDDQNAFYRDPQNPAHRWTAEGYLDQRIQQDGPWGVLLMQTSEQAGTNNTRGKSPDELTGDGTDIGKGTKHLELAGYNTDSMGVFEWLALTLQEDPLKLSPGDYSWLLANRLDVNGTLYVPVGLWNDDRVESRLFDAGYAHGPWRPRLAVM